MAETRVGNHGNGWGWWFHTEYQTDLGEHHPAQETEIHSARERTGKHGAHQEASVTCVDSCPRCTPCSDN
jgi:hypothetical protein